MKLRSLLAMTSLLNRSPEHPALDTEVTGLATNSHACQPGDLFLGMPGTRVDGGEFWQSAIERGAVAALVSFQAWQADAKLQEGGSTESLVIPIADMVQACAAIAAAFYGHPVQTLKLVGVTGTNGKTTVTHLIEFLLNQAHRPSALIGTLYTRWAGYKRTSANTTPFATELHQHLAAAVTAGCEFGVMEVSSHALAQRRVLGCPFEVAVFTNLTQDHLDYHQDMESYFTAKAMLFSPDYLQSRAVINGDDVYGQRLIDRISPNQVWTYSTQAPADLWTSDLKYSVTGVEGQLHTPQGDRAFRSPLVGQFNLENLLAAVGAVLHLGLNLDQIVATLPDFPGVPGRMERVTVDATQDISVIVDYAHTPDSLDNLLRAARPFIPGQMICVFGGGGYRERTKRPEMGRIVAEGADQAVITSDNPRTENPDMILQDILVGIPDTANSLVIADRAAAIRTAVLHAKRGDGVLIAGKGHEDYQILGTEKIHFDDREQAREALLLRAKSTPIAP